MIIDHEIFKYGESYQFITDVINIQQRRRELFFHGVYGGPTANAQFP